MGRINDDIQQAFLDIRQHFSGSESRAPGGSGTTPNRTTSTRDNEGASYRPAPPSSTRSEEMHIRSTHGHPHLLAGRGSPGRSHIPPVRRHTRMTQIPGARHSSSWYQGHDRDEPEGLPMAITRSIADQLAIVQRTIDADEQKVEDDHAPQANGSNREPVAQTAGEHRQQQVNTTPTSSVANTSAAGAASATGDDSPEDESETDTETEAGAARGSSSQSE